VVVVGGGLGIRSPPGGLIQRVRLTTRVEMRCIKDDDRKIALAGYIIRSDECNKIEKKEADLRRKTKVGMTEGWEGLIFIQSCLGQNTMTMGAALQQRRQDVCL
jgi:hypothetical protein